MKLFQDILTNCHLAAAFAVCLLLAVLSGCSDQDQPAVQQPGDAAGEETDGEGYRLELRIGFDDMDGSRSDPEPTTPPLPTTQGNKFENTINTLTLFVYNSSGKLVASPTLSSTDYAALPFTATSENHYLYLVREIEGIQHGNYTVYVAANLSPTQIEEIKLELAEELAKTTPPTKFYTLPGSHVNIAADLTSATYGMAMSCNDSDSFEFTPSKTGGLCTFHLKRVVAKVLVTAETTDATNKYVKVHTEADQDPKFMVLLDDVSFTVNSVNKHTFLYQHGTYPATEKPYVLDPNKDLIAEADDQFVYNTIESWSNFTSYFKKVKPHDPSKYLYNTYPKDDVYDGSIIYFPENTFAIPDPPISLSEAEKQATHVIVRAKITPLTLMVTVGFKDFAAGEVGTELYNLIASEEDQALALNPEATIYSIHCTKPEYSPLICELSLKYENFLGAVSNSTFFVKEEDLNKDLYTYSAAKYVAQGTAYERQEGNTLKLSGFEVYNDGYANYTVFIEDLRTGLSSDPDNPWKFSQIFRNTYYILRIEKFMTPGHGLDPEEDYIQVHTKVVPYINSWKGQIDIDDDTPTAS